MRLLGYLAAAAGLLLIAAPQGAWGQQQGKRATPPPFEATGFSIFFKDVFEEGLEGERPDMLSANRPAPAAMAGAAEGTGSQADGSSGSSHDWASIISATTLQDEVKRLNNQLADTVQNVRRFNGGGFQEARRDFTELALLFKIISEYDGDVRWKDFALTARDLFARVGYNTKVGTDNSFNEAKVRVQDLDQLVRGGSIVKNDGDPSATWDEIADRPPLMQRLEIAFLQRLNKMTANANEFRENQEEILHEAEIIAAIGHAMQQEGFEYWDDDDYVSYCQQMQQAALDVVKAVKDNNAEAARLAAGEIAKSCSGCHDGYR